MKKLIQHILSQKKYTRTLAVIVIVAAGFGAYTARTVYNNVQDMNTVTEAPAYYPPYPAANPEGKDTKLIQRGEYLTKAGDCIACHTNSPEKGTPFAGALAIKTPFGIIYSPNITPDKATGIGGWTQAEFNKVIREGISPKGQYYYPAFPFLYFNKLTDEDLQAIKAYLDNIPAVKQENRANTMAFPFNWRFLQLGWRIMFFRSNENTGAYQTDPAQSAQWNEGKYLVQGLGHCAMCHTPSYNIFSKDLPLAAPIRKYDLTGAPIQGYLAPNISKSNIGTVSDEEITQVFSQDRMIGGGKIIGPMLEANHDSLMYLTHEDMLAMATYLKTVDSKLPPKPKAGSGGAGKSTYEGYCAGCHASGAGGAPKFGDMTAWDAVKKKGIDQVYTNAIKGINGMPAKGTCSSCSDEEIKQAVDYMIKGGSVQAAIAAPPLKKLSMADGKRLYEANCAVCHNSGFKNAPKPNDLQSCRKMSNDGFMTAYRNVVDGKDGHPARGACANCTDAELKAAVKYLMQQGTSSKDYDLW